MPRATADLAAVPSQVMALVRSRRRLAAVVLAAVWVVAPAVEALAAWTAAGSGNAAAASTSVPAGPTPSLSVNGRNVTVSWAARTLASGDPVTGYGVRRAGATIGASCNSVQTGLSCTETAVAPGNWSYSITALAGSWSGAQGAQASVVVPPAAFTLSAATVASPATVSGTVSGFVGPATLSFRLDNPTSGTVLSATPASVPSGGRADVTVTLPAGVSDGPHTVFAIGSGGDVVGAGVTVDATRPTPTALVTADGGGSTGSVETGDSLAVTFSEPLLASSLCAAWADDGTAKSLTSGVTVSVANNGSTTSTDLLTVIVPACGGTGFRFGTLDLGGKGYVRSGSTATWGATGQSSTITWDPTTATLRIVLGFSTTNRFGTVNSSVAVYTPDPAMTDLRGLPITGTVSRSAKQF